MPVRVHQGQAQVGDSRAAQVTRGSLASPQRCSPGDVRKDGLASGEKKELKKKNEKHKTAQLAACGDGKKK